MPAPPPRRLKREPEPEPSTDTAVQVYPCNDCVHGRHAVCEDAVMPFCGCRREWRHNVPQ